MHSNARRVLLRQPTRRRVFDAIQAKPGTHARAISREVCLALGSVEHHVRQLEKHGVVFAYQCGRRRTLFVAGDVDPRDAPVIHGLRNPAWADLLAVLLDAEWSVSEVARELDVPATSVSYHLRRMRDAGLLQCLRMGRESIYSIEDPGRVRRWMRELQPAKAPHEAFVGLVARAVTHKVPVVHTALCED